MKTTQTIRNSLLAAGLLLSMGSCKRSVEEAMLNTKANTSNQSERLSLAPQFAKNLWFDQQGYNQLLTDLADSSAALKIRSFYEPMATKGLSYTPKGYVNIMDSLADPEASKAMRFLEPMTLKWVITSDSATKKPYLDKIVQILKAWATINRVQWHTPKESRFLDFYAVYSVIRDSILPADRNIIDSWIRVRARIGYQNFLNNTRTSGNWETIRLAFLFYSAYILREPELLKSAQAAYEKYANIQLMDSRGTTIDLNGRDAFDYHGYAMQYEAKIANAVALMEGNGAGLAFFLKKNKYGYSNEDALNRWHPYLVGKYHLEFEHSIFGAERRERVGPFNPKGAGYVLQQLVRIMPDKIFPYLFYNGGNRFSNFTLYRHMLNNTNPSTVLNMDTTQNPFLGKEMVNVAVGKTTSQSSTNYGAGSQRAVDGNTSGIFRDSSVTHTLNQKTAQWWQVDLGSLVNPITEIRIFNRVDCCPGKLMRYYVFISDNPITGNTLDEIKMQPGITTILETHPGGYPTIFPINRSGRYIRVQLSDTTQSLSLAEVQVMQLKPETGVQFFQHAKYNGASTRLIPKGNYTLQQLQAYGFVNDWASSVQLPMGWSLTLYSGDHFTGDSWTLTSSNKWLGGITPNANDKISSVKIQ